MKYCSQREAYLNGELSGAALDGYLAHLEQCHRCSAAVREWQSIGDQMRVWGDERRLPAPDRAEAMALMDRIRDQKPARDQRTERRWLGRLGYLAVAAVLLVSAGFVVRLFFQPRAPGPRSPQRIASSSPRLRVLVAHGNESVTRDEHGRALLWVAGEGRLLVALARDRIGLGATSRLSVLDQRRQQILLKLHHGKVAVSVEPRKGRGSFVVEAGRVRVTVIGTLFQVSIDRSSNVEVRVLEGRVVVSRSEAPRREVHAGRTLRIDAAGKVTSAVLEPRYRAEMEGLLSAVSAPPRAPDVSMGVGDDDGGAPAAPTMPARKRRPARDLSTWRVWLLAGRHRAATMALKTYLRSSPRDSEGWSLLAECHRRARQWKMAVAAYRKVISLGSVKVAQRARFKAARLLQDRLGRHSAAARLLKSYLLRVRGTRLLEAEALYRLGRAFWAQGRKIEARRALEKVLSRHRGTSAAIRAHKLLKTLNKTKAPRPQ